MAALADPIAKDRLRQFVATAHPVTIELNGQRYKAIRVPSHIAPCPDNKISD